MKILIGTQNTEKIQGVKQAFEIYFCEVEIQGIAVDSEVGAQPVNEQIMQGAKNRVKNLKDYAKKHKIQADYYVASEGGITDLLGEWFDFNIVVVENAQGFQSKGSSQGLPIPGKYIEEIIQTELGIVMRKVLNKNTQGKEKGGISILTHGEVTRLDFVKNATVMALVKQINGEIWN